METERPARSLRVRECESWSRKCCCVKSLHVWLCEKRRVALCSVLYMGGSDVVGVVGIASIAGRA